MTMVVYSGISSTGRMVRQITAATTDSTATMVSLSLRVVGCGSITFGVGYGACYSKRVSSIFICFYLLLLLSWISYSVLLISLFIGGSLRCWPFIVSCYRLLLVK